MTGGSSHSSLIQKRPQTPDPALLPSPRRPQLHYFTTFPSPELFKGHLSHQEDSKGLVGCPGPKTHHEGRDNRFCGCWEAYEGAVGGREATGGVIKLVALNIKDTGWLSP